MRVAVVAVGDELLLGDVVNTNLARLGRALAVAGLECVRGVEVGDDPDEVVLAVRDLLPEVDAVILSGGLGPTSDDRTPDAVRRLAGAGPVRPVPNRVGTADGLDVTVDGRRLFAVPGVPAELDEMVARHVVPELRRLAGDPPPLLTRQLRVAATGEPAVARLLVPLEAELPDGVRLAYLAAPGEIRVRVSGRSPDLLADVVERAAELLGPAVSGLDDETLPATVLRLLGERGATLAVAESLTGGRVLGGLVDVPGASAVLRGGVVAYATDAKRELLGVPAALLDDRGAVQAEVALAMAHGVRDRLAAAYGLATTGVAGPDPQDGHPPGTVHLAVAGPAGLQRTSAPVLRGDRERIRTLATVHALDLLRRCVLGVPGLAGPACQPPSG